MVVYMVPVFSSVLISIIISFKINVILAQYQDMTCDSDYHYVNDYDGALDNGQSSRFVNGMSSSHENWYEDRLFKWRYCRQSDGSVPAFTTKIVLTTTGYDESWTRSCENENNGHSAIIGGTSTHDNTYEDRIWTFECGNLDTSLFSLTDCYWSGSLNSYDNTFSYDCANNGVVRAIHSKHDNYYEDRIWEFECCRISTFWFTEPIGFWHPLHICGGCGEFEYQIEEGIDKSTEETISNEYSSNLESTVAAGYEYAGASVNVEVSGGVSVHFHHINGDNL